MGLINPPDLTNGTKADANDVNAIKAEIVGAINGNIEATNIKDGTISAAELASGSVTVNKIPDGEITKVKLEKPHIGQLTYANGDVGQVFTNAQQQFKFDTASPNNFGVTAALFPTVSDPYIQVNRDGWYSLDAQLTCIDVRATYPIFWFRFLASGAGSYSYIRSEDMGVIEVGTSKMFTAKQWLTAGTKVGIDGFCTNNTRLGGSGGYNASTLTVTEIR